MKTVDTQPIIERAKTHGDYFDVAMYTAAFRKILDLAEGDRFENKLPPLTDTQRLSLDMIMNKIARILSGQSSLEEHWKDISGYAYIANKQKGVPYAD